MLNRFRSIRSVMMLLAAGASLCLPAYAQEAERYEVALTKHITLSQEYPAEAKAYGIEGDAIIRIRVAKDGTIIGYALTKSPGNKSLEGAIRQMVKKANPAPPPPEDVLKGRNAAEFMLPIAFRLDNNPESLIPIDRLFQKQVKQAWKKAVPSNSIAEPGTAE